MNALDRECLYRAVSEQSGLHPDLLRPSHCKMALERSERELRAAIFGQTQPVSQLFDILRSRFLQRFIGWDHAVETCVANWDCRPVAALLLCGPTGVGKTDTANRLASMLFDGRIITLACSEVGPESPHAIATWTGSPPGYVGYGQGGLLTNGLRIHRTAIILFDEIEKAAPEVIQNILLPLLGAGTVTDRNSGETLWATDCIVVCTSNLGAEAADVGALGFSHTKHVSEDDDEKLSDRLARQFRPELLGRFHGVLRYNKLSRKTQWQIWSSLCDELALKVGPGTQIVLSDEANQFVRDRFRKMTGGAREVTDLFHQQMTPLAVNARRGEIIRVTVDKAHRLQRLGPAR